MTPTSISGLVARRSRAAAARADVRLAERAADAERVEAVRALGFRHLRIEVDERRRLRAGSAEEALRHVRLVPVRVVDLELEVHVEVRVVRDLAQLDAAVARDVDVAALRGDLRDLEDAVLRLAV